MIRRLQIGTISPKVKGSNFGLNAASYPPPSALSTKTPKPASKKRISEMAVRKEKGPGIYAIADLSSKRGVKEGAISLPEKIYGPGALGEVFQYSIFEVPEQFSGFGSVFKSLNSELCSIQSDPEIPSEIRLALDAGISSFNKLLLADATDVSKLHASRHYIAFLRLSDHYEKKAGEFLKGAKGKNLSGMIETAGKMGINLPNLLYKKGVYIKLGRKK